MKILYLSPGSGMTTAERQRREHVLNMYASAGATVSIRSVEKGPVSIESAVEEEIAAAEVVRAMVNLQAEFDASIIGCFGDPGLRACRELAKIPIIGPAESTFYLSSQVADRFGVLVSLKRDIAPTRALLAKYELLHKCATIEPINMQVLAIREDQSRTSSELARASHKAVENGAECLIPGCMSLSFYVAEYGAPTNIEVPVLNPVGISVRTAETFVTLGMTHSRRSYPEADYEKLRATVFKA